MKKFLGKLFCAIGVVAVVVVGIGIYESTQNQTTTKEDTSEGIVTKEAGKMSVEILQDAFNDASEYVGLNYDYTAEGTYTQPGIKIWIIPIPFTSNKLVADCSGNIKYGIEMNECKVDQDVETKVITINCPQSTVISNQLNEEDWQTITENDSAFNNLTSSEMNEFRQAVKNKGQEIAEGKDAISKSNKNVEEHLVSFVQDLVPGADVQVVFA